MEQTNVPDFMKKYHDASDYEAKHELENLVSSVYRFTVLAQKPRLKWNKNS